MSGWPYLVVNVIMWIAPTMTCPCCLAHSVDGLNSPLQLSSWQQHTVTGWPWRRSANWWHVPFTETLCTCIGNITLFSYKIECETLRFDYFILAKHYVVLNIIWCETSRFVTSKINNWGRKHYLLQINACTAHHTILLKYMMMIWCSFFKPHSRLRFELAAETSVGLHLQRRKPLGHH